MPSAGSRVALGFRQQSPWTVGGREPRRNSLTSSALSDHFCQTVQHLAEDLALKMPLRQGLQFAESVWVRTTDFLGRPLSAL